MCEILLKTDLSISFKLMFQFLTTSCSWHFTYCHFCCWQTHSKMWPFNTTEFSLWGQRCTRGGGQQTSSLLSFAPRATTVLSWWSCCFLKPLAVIQVTALILAMLQNWLNYSQRESLNVGVVKKGQCCYFRVEALKKISNSLNSTVVKK